MYMYLQASIVNASSRCVNYYRHKEILVQYHPDQLFSFLPLLKISGTYTDQYASASTKSDENKDSNGAYAPPQQILHFQIDSHKSCLTVRR